MYRIITLVFLLIAGLLLQMVQAQPLESKTIYQMHEDNVFQIRVLNRETGKKSSIGSGFIVGDGRQVATNFHVISQIVTEPERFYISFLSKNGRSGELKLLGLDIAHDLALLGSELVLGQANKTSELPPKGSPVFAMGNPHDLGLTIAVGTNGGILNQTDDSRILFSGSLNPGMSGGPTFNDKGEVVGINVATSRNAISFIVPSLYLNRLIEWVKKEPLDAKQNLKAEVTQQLIEYENNYLKGILDTDWPKIQLRQLSVPGAISPTVRCWDNSRKLPEKALYKRYQINCANQNQVYLDSQNKFVGNLNYHYFWLESDELNSLQFYNLYQKLNESKIGGRVSQEVVSNFHCKTWFVDVSQQTFKTSLCRREYVEYEGLSDILFTAALTGHDNKGFFVRLTMTGIDYDAGLPLIQKFMENIEWTP
jgi:serine protease Do